MKGFMLDHIFTTYGKFKLNISGCSAVGDVCERTLRVIKRAIRSGSNTAIDELTAMAEPMLQQEAQRTTVQIQFKLNISGCSAVGSARALGAGHRLLIMKSRKTPKALVNIGFFGTLLSLKILCKSGLTTCLTTYGKTAKNSIFFTLRGVAQLVARDVWDVDAAGSNPVTPTKFGFGK